MFYVLHSPTFLRKKSAIGIFEIYTDKIDEVIVAKHIY